MAADRRSTNPLWSVLIPLLVTTSTLTILFQILLGLSPVVSYLSSVNIATFSLWCIDKVQAIRRSTRIPEVILLVSAVIGGGMGGVLGMILFRHKIRKRIFWLICISSSLFYLLLIISLLSGWISFPIPSSTRPSLSPG